MIPRLLILASAIIIFSLGSLHLWLTFVGAKLKPRDPELEARLKNVSPVITSQTTMWKGWVGFNASHSFGMLLFGALYGYLALVQSNLLFHSPFLALVGALLLAGYVVLGKLYWFSAPLRGIVLASICYAAGFIGSRI
jgi:hypothetical protein